jgi:hypothetical protein
VVQSEHRILNRSSAVFGRRVQGARLVREKAPGLILPKMLRSSDYCVFFNPAIGIRKSSHHRDDIAIFCAARQNVIDKPSPGGADLSLARMRRSPCGCGILHKRSERC